MHCEYWPQAIFDTLRKSDTATWNTTAATIMIVLGVTQFPGDLMSDASELCDAFLKVIYC
jgi:hypothetical protein